MQSARLSKRVRQLEALKNALSMISTEIRYFASPVPVIMSKLALLDEYRELRIFNLCENNLSRTQDFQRAWELSLRQAEPALTLNKGDLETLSWFGTTFGATDIEGQVANCERYSQMISQRLKDAREDKLKKGKMYASLGVLAGVFFIVIFI